MSDVNLPIWSLCPFRSPVAPVSEPIVKFPGNTLGEATWSPPQALGPCLYAGCGLYKVTKIVDGKVVDGMCGIRFLGEVMNSIAGSLEQLTKLETMKTMGDGQPSIFKG
jgi:hypothetical protein